MKTILPLASHRRGFSLVEMLTTISILGIMCSIVIPMLPSEDRYAAARDKRNAQEIVALCEEARAIGVDLVVPGNLEQTLANLVRGATIEKGAFKGKVLSLSSMTLEIANKAKRFLRLDGNNLRVSTPEGNVASGGNSNASIFGKHKKSLAARLA